MLEFSRLKGDDGEFEVCVLVEFYGMNILDKRWAARVGIEGDNAELGVREVSADLIICSWAEEVDARMLQESYACPKGTDEDNLRVGDAFNEESDGFLVEPFVNHTNIDDARLRYARILVRLFS